MTIPGWTRYVVGKAVRYRDEATGQTISRRQYDRLYGRLKELGFRTYEKQAKAAREVGVSHVPFGLSESAPRKINRIPGTQSSASTLRRLRPLAGRVVRVVQDGSTAESYDAMKAALEKNSAIDGVMAGALYERTIAETGHVARWTRWLANKNGHTVVSGWGLIVDGVTAEFNVINGYFADRGNSDGGETGQYENFKSFVFYLRFKESAKRQKDGRKRKKSRRKEGKI